MANMSLSTHEVDVVLSEVSRYRTGMAGLLKSRIGEINEIKRRLGVIVGDDASERAALEDVPLGVFRLHCALLLHKSQMHMVAVLGANESNNMHSLAVQMRPVLECAGQVVLVNHNLFIEPEHIGKVNDYIDRDYVETLVRTTKGQLNHKRLLNRISRIRKEFDKEPLSKGSFEQADKVAPLYSGKEWYGLLSEKFSHGERGLVRRLLARRG